MTLEQIKQYALENGVTVALAYTRLQLMYAEKEKQRKQEKRSKKLSRQVYNEFWKNVYDRPDSYWKYIEKHQNFEYWKYSGKDPRLPPYPPTQLIIQQSN